jgi:hypothetical protein
MQQAEKIRAYTQRKANAREGSIDSTTDGGSSVVADTIFISTDSQPLLEQLLASSNYSHWTIMYLPEQRQQGGHERGLHTTLNIAQDIDHYAMQVFSNLFLASDCGYFVGTLGSFYGRFIDHLRMTNGRYYSGSTPWHTLHYSSYYCISPYPSPHQPRHQPPPANHHTHHHYHCLTTSRVEGYVTFNLKLSTAIPGDWSIQRVTKINVQFINRLDVELEVFWVEKGTILHSVGTIKPGVTQTVNSFWDHRFQVKTYEGLDPKTGKSKGLTMYSPVRHVLVGRAATDPMYLKDGVDFQDVEITPGE